MSIGAAAQFAASDEEAQQRFEATRRADPFPEVAPSLLNTADLLDYIRATGMIYPFDLPLDLDKGLKPASCAIAFSGRVIAWNPDPKQPDRLERFDEHKKPGETLKLPHNSIVFITLEPHFRLPDYIAARYNLEIRQIYRGLLVGTGPLVDPGFDGVLSVPVHNLTGSDYELRAGEPLVWMEFTKLSANRRWDGAARESLSPYVPFPPRKVVERRGLDDYIKAASSDPIVSSIPQEVGQARRAAERAQRSAQRFERVSVFAGVVLLVTIAALVLQAMSTIRDEGRDRAALEVRLTDLNRVVRTQQRELDAVRLQVRRLAGRRP